MTRTIELRDLITTIAASMILGSILTLTILALFHLTPSTNDLRGCGMVDVTGKMSWWYARADGRCYDVDRLDAP